MTDNVTKLQPGHDPNKDPENPEFEPTRRAIAALINDGEIAARRLARESGNNEAAVNHFLNRKPDTGTRFDRVVDRLNQWLDTRDRRIASQARFPEAPKFVLTPTSERIMEANHNPHTMGNSRSVSPTWSSSSPPPDGPPGRTSLCPAPTWSHSSRPLR